MTPWLSDAEVRDLCEPLTQAAAQIRYMRDSLGLVVKTKPNGRPLVLRAEVETLLALPDQENAATARPGPAATPSAPTPRQPNASGLVLAFHRK